MVWHEVLGARHGISRALSTGSLQGQTLVSKSQAGPSLHRRNLREGRLPLGEDPAPQAEAQEHDNLVSLWVTRGKGVSALQQENKCVNEPLLTGLQVPGRGEGGGRAALRASGHLVSHLSSSSSTSKSCVTPRTQEIYDPLPQTWKLRLREALCPRS